MKSIIILFSFLALAFASCQSDNKSNEKKSSPNEYEIDENLSPSGENMSASDKAKLEEVMAESKKTLDSIDLAYSFVQRERSRMQNLSVDERQQINIALAELNEAQDLIILEMEAEIINGLKEKTASLQTIMKDMNTKSDRLMHIAQTLSRVSGVITKTTNLLAGALAVGLIRPRIVPTPGP